MDEEDAAQASTPTQDCWRATWTASAGSDWSVNGFLPQRQWVGINLPDQSGKPSARPEIARRFQVRSTAATFLSQVFRLFGVPQLSVTFSFCRQQESYKDIGHPRILHGTSRLHLPIVSHPDVRFNQTASVTWP